MPLTLGVAVKLGPIVFLTALRHFLEKYGMTEPSGSKAKEELLYDEAFSVVKAFLEAASRHTVEELQEFSNTRVPVPPSVRSIRLLIPLSSCSQAATYLIKVLGGEEQARHILGGTRWWQVRGVKGIDANWIVVKKDLEVANKMRKMGFQQENGNEHETGGDNAESDGQYSSELDPLRCMYYIHGGGYFFGSVDQERYSMQRYARKMNGRIFAINYRLAPQYPFPCAIQDALAGYLYLLRPPPDALHAAVNPSQIIICGDSAGGGIILGLLQILRDAGLPLPAGCVLISPWGDLTHSFPSVFENTATDVIPSYGLGIYRPSTLWPPPPDDMGAEVKRKLTNRIRSMVKVENIESPTLSRMSSIFASPTTSTSSGSSPTTPQTSLGDTIIEPPSIGEDTKHPLELTLSSLHPRVVHPPPEDPKAEPHVELPLMRGKGLALEIDGKAVEIKSQIQLYAMNHQLSHPLVSPALGYLGGLPPLFFIASDGEVLRDEIVYMAHKAAHPDEYPVRESLEQLYPPLKGIRERYGPTKVHLQIYDGTCHVLPLFSFTTPAKFCYRAIAAFCRYVAPSSLDEGRPSRNDVTPSQATVAGDQPTSDHGQPYSKPGSRSPSSHSAQRNHQPSSFFRASQDLFKRGRSPSERKTSSSKAQEEQGPSPKKRESRENEDVEPRFEVRRTKSGPGFAGNANAYKVDDPSASPFKDHMIRERVSTKGELRELDPPSQLAGCSQPFEKIGHVTETGAKRYLGGQAVWDMKYAKEVKRVAKHRQKHLKLAKEETSVSLEKLKARLDKERMSSDSGMEGNRSPTGSNLSEEGDKVDINSPLWNWSWALEGENPPPSSIVARRDTREARRLSWSADRYLEEHESRLSGNNLWAIAVDFLSSHSHKVKPNGTNLQEETTPAGSSANIYSDSPRVVEPESFFRKLFHGHRA